MINSLAAPEGLVDDEDPDDIVRQEIAAIVRLCGDGCDDSVSGSFVLDEGGLINYAERQGYKYFAQYLRERIHDERQFAAYGEPDSVLISVGYGDHVILQLNETCAGFSYSDGGFYAVGDEMIDGALFKAIIRDLGSFVPHLYNTFCSPQLPTEDTLDTQCDLLRPSEISKESGQKPRRHLARLAFILSRI